MKMGPVDGDDDNEDGVEDEADDVGAADAANQSSADDVGAADAAHQSSADDASADDHPFDVASQEADDESNLLIPPQGRIDVVAEPVRYRRGPVYALLAVAVLPALGLLWVHRWAEDEADRYDAEVARLEAERSVPPVRGAAIVGVVNGVSSPTTADGELPGDGVEADGDDAAGDDAEGDEAEDDEDRSEELATALLSYRRTPSSIAGLANARSLAETLSDFSDRLDFGVCFAASVDGIRVAAHASSVPLIPASNQKIIVAATALDVLGPDHVFETSVAVPAPVDGVVDGDIYLIGGGDPLLTSDDYPIEDDRFPAFNTTSFDVLADAVAAAGVTRIRGTVIGDGTRYDDEFTVESWASGIAGVEAGPYDALFVNDARVRGRGGRESDPNTAAAREFARLLGNRGVRVDNGWGSGSRSTLVPIIGTVTSAPLSDIVDEMLVNSDDDTAELLVKEIGLIARGEGTRQAGLEVMREWLTAAGIPTLGVELADGSGLSNGNRLTCEVVLAVLQEMRDEGFAASLPIAGRTGTLTSEFDGSPLEGRLRAKTGTLNIGSVDPPSVKALSGYVPGTGAGTIEFALIANAPGITEENAYQALWNALAELLATHPAGPDVIDLGPVSVDAE